MLDIWYIFLILFVIFFVWRGDLRREMLLTGALAVPVFFVEPLFLKDFSEIIHSSGGYFAFFATRLILGFSVGAITSVFYEILLKKRFSIISHPHKRKLLFLIIGIIALFVFHYFFHYSVVISLILSLLINLVIIVIIRPDLIWDMLYSGFGMSIFYLVLFLLVSASMPGEVRSGFWFADSLSGINIFSVPMEELIAVMLFGALFGPIYAAIRGYGENLPLDFKAKHFGFKIVLGQFIIIIMSAGILVLISQTAFSPKVIKASVTENPVGLSEEIVLNFNRPLKRSNIGLAITPYVQGEWVFKGLLNNRLATSLTFVPTEPFQSDTQYKIIVNDIAGFLSAHGEDYTLDFTTQKLPNLTAFSVTDGQTNVSACDTISAKLDSDMTNLINFNFTLVPEVPIEIISSKREIIIKPSRCLEQGTNYTLSSTRSAPDGKINKADLVPNTISVAFQTKLPPKINSFSPQGGNILVNSNVIRVEFGEAMNLDLSKFSIEPILKGQWTSDNNKQASFVAEELLQFETQYTIKIAKGLQDITGGFINDDTVFHFSTIGHVQVTGSSPQNNATNVGVGSPISISFNQEINKSSAEQAFSISPATTGKFSWNGNKLIFSPDNELAKSERYSVAIATGVKSINGLPLSESFNFGFQTEIPVYLLNIPIDFQDHALSCEFASLKMALNYRGANVSEDNLINLVGFDQTARGDNLWGDPDVAFVGDINGRQNTSGYGVHWGPIASVANNYRRAEAFSSWSVSQIAGEIAAGNPVIIWGTYGNATRSSWVTPAGRTIDTWKGEHARLVIGVRGKLDNPTSFIINDPIKGQITWSAATLRDNLSAFNNSGVVVY